MYRNSVDHACSLGLNREEYLNICSKEFDQMVCSAKQKENFVETV
jgi:hypothetical protein